MSNNNPTIDVLLWQLQYNLLFDFVYKMASSGDSDASEVIRNVAQLDAAPITENLNGHFAMLLRLIDEIDTAAKDTAQSGSTANMHSVDLGTLRAYVKALQEGFDVPCPQCSPIGKMDPLCETCGGAGNLPVLRSVQVDSEHSLSVLTPAGEKVSEQVIIKVEGGVAYVYSCPDHIEVEIIDLDNGGILPNNPLDPTTRQSLSCYSCYTTQAEDYVPIYEDPAPGREQNVKYHLCTACYDTSFAMQPN